MAKITKCFNYGNFRIHRQCSLKFLINNAARKNKRMSWITILPSRSY